MKNYVTKQGYQKMIDDLNDLINIDMKQAIEMIQEARDKGDLSENAEYEAAKEHHQKLSYRISVLKSKIQSAEIISHAPSKGVVGMLSTVVVKNEKTGSSHTWTLVPENEIDAKNGKISFNSPIGSSLMGHKTNDIVDVTVPAGTMRLEILDVN